MKTKVRWIAALVLLTICAFTYAPARTFDFILFDDDEYVYANPAVHAGISLAGVEWAFGFHSGNWHPLTWLSHMLDVQLFGVNPGAHHAVSVLLHLLNVALLMVALVRLTGAFWRSFVLAALFALHPLNVENVAWVAERKTLLCITFLLATIIVWHVAVSSRSGKRMGLAVALFACAVMAKPYAVTLPVLLLLLDVWPLHRAAVTDLLDVRRWRESLWPLLREKIPFAICSLVSAALTVAAQRSEGAVASVSTIGFIERIFTASAGLGWYVQKLFWPAALSFYYPHAHSYGELTSRPAALLGLGILVVGTGAAVAAGRARAYVAVGWAWFLIALLPVIGLVQVGYQAYADRYAYLPMIGLLLAVVWFLSDLATGPVARRSFAAVALIVIAALSAVTGAQVRHWRSSEALFTHAIEVNPRNWVAWQNLGVKALQENDVERASTFFAKSLESSPGNGMAFYNLGYVHSLRGQTAQARRYYEQALAMRPGDPLVLTALALTYRDLRFPAEALELARRAVSIAPHSQQALYGLVLIAGEAGMMPEARAALVRLQVIDPALARDAESMLRARL